MVIVFFIYQFNQRISSQSIPPVVLCTLYDTQFVSDMRCRSVVLTTGPSVSVVILLTALITLNKKTNITLWEQFHF